MGKRGKVLGVLFAAVLIMVGNVNAYAASSANWNVNYLKGAPQQSANPVSYASIAFDSDGCYINCTYLTGSYDRQVTVSSENAGGIKGGNKYIRSVGKTKTFYMNKSSSKDITYKFVATGSESCNAKGTIYKVV